MGDGGLLWKGELRRSRRRNRNRNDGRAHGAPQLRPDLRRALRCPTAQDLPAAATAAIDGGFAAASTRRGSVPLVAPPQEHAPFATARRPVESRLRRLVAHRISTRSCYRCVTAVPYQRRKEPRNRCNYGVLGALCLAGCSRNSFCPGSTRIAAWHPVGHPPRSTVFSSDRQNCRSAPLKNRRDPLEDLR